MLLTSPKWLAIILWAAGKLPGWDRSPRFLVAVACDSRPSSSTPDSASAAGGPGNADSVATTVSSSGWDSGAGPFVVLPTVDGGLMAGSLLRPDASELTVGDTTGIGAASADGRIELFARSGKVGVARLFEVEAGQFAEIQGLQAAGQPVEWHDYPMEHSVCIEEVRALEGFLRKTGLDEKQLVERDGVLERDAEQHPCLLD